MHHISEAPDCPAETAIRVKEERVRKANAPPSGVSDSKRSKLETSKKYPARNEQSGDTKRQENCNSRPQSAIQDPSPTISHLNAKTQFSN